MLQSSPEIPFIITGNSSQMQLAQRYKYFQETRSPNEITVSINLCRLLTQRNVDRISKIQSCDHSKKHDILFVFLTGIPTYPDELDNLYLPGQVLRVDLKGFKNNLTESQIQKQCHQASLLTQAAELKAKIEQRLQETGLKKLVFLYHSFGSFVFLTFWRLYGSIFHENPQKQIVGIIELGGAPIRFYQVLKNITLWAASVPNREFLWENLDFLHSEYNKNVAKINKKSKNKQLKPIESKFQTYSFANSVMSDSVFECIFEYSRNLPVTFPKLFLFGRNDQFFSESTLCEKAVYYSYLKTIPKEMQEPLIQRYETLHGEKVKNIQERFIFNLQKGSHSIHMQKDHIGTINRAIMDYLQLLNPQQ